MSFDDEDYVETTLCVLKECFVYRIPPRTTSHGYRAADWNLDQPMWTGRCVVTSEGDKCKVKLEDPNTGELFATCPVTEAAIEPVNDSSRYYVVKIEDGSGRHAFIGMGFAERNSAFDFSSALQDHAKYIASKKDMEKAALLAASQPKVDYSLPQGAKIHVELKNRKPTNPSSTSSSSTGFLPPPPSSSRAKATPTKSNSQGFFNDDMFGSQSQPNQQSFGQPDFFSQQPTSQSSQGFQNQQFQPQQSNDFWGDFTGSTPAPQQQQSGKSQQTEWFF